MNAIFSYVPLLSARSSGRILRSSSWNTMPGLSWSSFGASKGSRSGDSTANSPSSSRNSKYASTGQRPRAGDAAGHQHRQACREPVERLEAQIIAIRCDGRRFSRMNPPRVRPSTHSLRAASTALERSRTRLRGVGLHQAPCKEG